MTDSAEPTVEQETNGASEMSPTAATELLHRLISDHHARVYRYAVHLTGSPGDAEDVAQQTFLTAQQRLHQLRDVDKAESWLLTIARTTFLKSIRRQRPVDAGSLDLNVGEIPEDAIDDLIDHEQLQDALATLSDDYRLVLLMFYFEDASYRDIADQLELPIGTVMSRLSRAKGKLRAALLSQDGLHGPCRSAAHVKRTERAEARDG